MFGEHEEVKLLAWVSDWKQGNIQPLEMTAPHISVSDKRGFFYMNFLGKISHLTLRILDIRR